ncbi:MAG: flagellar basal body-associated FliL family protein [Clostridiales bacterium]|nr:flagellar basal body-associated FliL family protein [Clostridiales bacterium]MCF8021713.1 flagellar basal body-associated FliL family protein [Clostridiales bacterium]
MANSENNKKYGPGFFKLVLAGLVIFLLGAGIVFGTLTMTGAMGGGDAQGGEKEDEQKPTSTLDMGSIIVNLADPGGSRYLKAEIILEYPENKDFTSELEKKEYMLTDTVIKILRSKEVEDIRPLDKVPVLKNEIKKAVNKRITRGEVTRVFFTEFIIQ